MASSRELPVDGLPADDLFVDGAVFDDSPAEISPASDSSVGTKAAVCSANLDEASTVVQEEINAPIAGVSPPTAGLAARAGMAMIRFYQRAISPLTPPACRFQPTCSQYTLVAIQRHGFIRGCWLGFLRILKCHPFHPGGHDPVPPRRPTDR